MTSHSTATRISSTILGNDAEIDESTTKFRASFHGFDTDANQRNGTITMDDAAALCIRLASVAWTPPHGATVPEEMRLDLAQKTSLPHWLYL